MLLSLVAPLSRSCYTRDARSTISVIIVAGACGVAAGTPLAILGGIGQAARAGVIVKGGVHLETLGRAQLLALDKTGTVTYGTPLVREVWPSPTSSTRELLSSAAAAEKHSEHPMAKAVLRYAEAEGVESANSDTVEYKPGLGILCASDGKQILVGNASFLESHGVRILEDSSGRASPGILVARGGRFLGSIAVEDALRREAVGALRQLREMGNPNRSC